MILLGRDIYAMGACVSTSQGCRRGRLSSSKNKKKSGMRRRYRLRRRVSSQLDNGSLDKGDMPDESSFANPTFQGSSFLFFFLTCIFLK